MMSMMVILSCDDVKKLFIIQKLSLCADACLGAGQHPDAGKEFNIKHKHTRN
jgi:hypothetical protein